MGYMEYTKVKDVLKLARKANRILVSFPGAGGCGALNVVKSDYISQLKDMLVQQGPDCELEGTYELHPNHNLYL